MSAQRPLNFPAALTDAQIKKLQATGFQEVVKQLRAEASAALVESEREISRFELAQSKEYHLAGSKHLDILCAQCICE